jgi:hypothetical protein
MQSPSQRREAAFLRLDATMLRLYGEPLNPDQRGCLTDPARADEARDMLDDMQARMGIPADVTGAAAIAIWARDHA